MIGSKKQQSQRKLALVAILLIVLAVFLFAASRSTGMYGFAKEPRDGGKFGKVGGRAGRVETAKQNKNPGAACLKKYANTALCSLTGCTPAPAPDCPVDSYIK